MLVLHNAETKSAALGNSALATSLAANNARPSGLPLTSNSAIKIRGRLGKYRIERRVALGGFAAVYQAMDTIEGIRVALKVPSSRLVTDELLNEFRKEVRLTAGLEHPNILPIKDASFINGRFVIVQPLGSETLSDRLSRRMSLSTILSITEQMLEATAYAHRSRVVHCDIKPENFIMFPGNRVRLADFGIAKLAQSTIQGSGTGTVGYMAPEQAMGKPSMRSDVFSLGLIIYRMLTGHWPEWPYEWPPVGYDRLRRRGVNRDFIDFVRRAMEPNPRKRYRDADHMLSAFRKLKRKTLLYAKRRRG